MAYKVVLIIKYTNTQKFFFKKLSNQPFLIRIHAGN